MRVFPADLSKSSLDFDSSILNDAQYVIHCAASTRLNATLAESRRDNVLATQNILDLSRSLPRLKRLIYFSTAYVSAQFRGLVNEDRQPKSFNNFYEQTKYEAEILVRNAGLPYTVLRPSIVTGRSDNGYIKGFKIFYAVFRVWLSGKIPRAPLSPHLKVDIVPIDYVVKATATLMLIPDAEAKTIHLCAGHRQIKARAVFRAALIEFGYSPRVNFFPTALISFLMIPPLRWFLSYDLSQVIEALRAHIPYLGSRARCFNDQMAVELMRSHRIQCPDPKDFVHQLFTFAAKSAWGKKNYKINPQFR